MDAKYLSWNFANFISVNLMVAVLLALIILVNRIWKSRGGAVKG